MGVFSSRDSDRSPQRRGSDESNLSIIATGLKIVGQLDSSGVIKVEGTVQGTVRAQRQVLLAKDGTIEGDVYTAEAIIGGRVVGSIHADERVEVQPHSSVRGDIVTPRLVVQEGGEVNGNVKMRDPKALSHHALEGEPAQQTERRPALEAAEQQAP